MARRFALAAVCVSLLLSLLLAELAVRLTGRTPWVSDRNDERNPRCYDPDPVLGWTNRPGVYRIPPYGPGGGPVTITNVADRTRATRRPGPAPAGRARVELIGCSVVQGWAISDEETLGWKLQERFPGWEVRNHGTGGYSGYQSLLVLERLLASGPPPSVVVFGLGDFHEPRNVADSWWLRLVASHDRRGHAEIPRVSVGPDGRLERHAPAPCPRWPLLRSSALVAFLHETWLDRKLLSREERKRETAFRVVSEMAERAKASGVRFVVLVVWMSTEARPAYVDFLEKAGIEYLDGSLDWTEPREALFVPQDGHPNGTMHTRWARRLGDRLKRD